MQFRRLLSSMPLSSLAGFLIIICMCLSLTISVVLSHTEFSPFDYWVEYFAITSENPNGAVFLQGGFILTGLLLIVFACGFTLWYTRNRWFNGLVLLGQLTGVFASISLIMKGITMMVFQMSPKLWATLFFVSVAITMLILCTCMIVRRGENEDTICVGFTAVALIFLYAITLWLNMAPEITEWFAVSSLLAWVALAARDIYRLRQMPCD